MCLRMHQRIPFPRRLSALWEVGLEKGSDSRQLGVEEAAEGAKRARAWGLCRESLHGRSGAGGEEVARAVTPGVKLQTAWGSPVQGTQAGLALDRSTRKNV